MTGKHDQLGRGGSIVVGLNGSPGAAGALRWAVEEARIRASPLRIVHTWVRGSRDYVAGEDLVQALELEALGRATGWVTAALGTMHVPGQLDIVEGAPGTVLVDRSRRAALLVVGAQAHQGLGRLMAGSISHYCLTHAACPIVAVPAPNPRRGRD